jgi:phage-related minor tail protein
MRSSTWRTPSSPRGSVLDVSDALDDYSGKALEAAAAGGKNTAANRDLERASISVRTHINDVAQAAQQQAEKEALLTGQTLSAAESADKQRGALINLRSTIAPNSPFRSYLDGLIHQLDVAAHDRRGSLHIDTSVTLQRLGITITADNRAVTRTGLDFRAEGGPARAGSPYVVGEKGPELFIPNTSGNIVPNGATSTGSAFGGMASVTNINIYAQGIGDRELGRQVVQALREYQRTRGPLNLKIAG